MQDDLYKANIIITGAVQGVGFRPFVYKLAKKFDIKGWVLNSGNGVEIKAISSQKVLKKFIEHLKTDKPDISYIKNFQYDIVPFTNDEKFSDFNIIHSKTDKEPITYIMPDIATCEDCLQEIFNPQDRRYLYPFTNCTNCGPRYTIIERLPYDRENTTMKNFIMCKKCREEYEDPDNRRFHAQPNACPVCGPKVILWNSIGNAIAEKEEAIKLAVQEILKGKIVAVKGLGGFHLIANPFIKDTIKELRRRKHRDEKPFALMFPDIISIEKYCFLTEKERIILTSQKSPILLIKLKEEFYFKRFNKSQQDNLEGVKIPFYDECVGENSNNPYLGILLPYTPLHHILMKFLKIPVIATSGNISDEPICFDEYEALMRLNSIADLFLIHNRPILRYVDDSIVKIVAGEEMILRRARGYAPLPIIVEDSNNERSPLNKSQIVATGSFLKNTIALKKENEVFISQHIGDLDNLESINAFERTISHLSEIYNINPSKIVCDLHPDFPSTKYAEEKSENINLVKVQHHIAHIYSCIAENDIPPPVLGIAWDGTGYGIDKNIWGSEFFLINSEVKRIAHLRYFRLPGGEESIKKVNRIIAGILLDFQDELQIEDIANLINMSEEEFRIIKQILEKGINSPKTSSMGRLFDAVSSLIDIKQFSSFEGQAAMELEFVAHQAKPENNNYNFEINTVNEIYEINFIPIIKEIIIDKNNNINKNIIAAKFHNTLSVIILEIAKKINIKNIALSGGCFQNSLLLENTIRKLNSSGFRTFWQKKIPINDGGISLGQLYYASLFQK